MFAWKIDSKLSVLVQTDLKRLSQLIFATFVQNQYLINDHLTLTRIQTVNIDGQAQDVNEIMNHSRKDILLRSTELLSLVDWEKHLDDIKHLSVLASQASEFEYKKNLTEGKTGCVVQPDIIPSSSASRVIDSPDTPKKSFISLEKTGEKIRELKQDLKKRDEAKSNSTASLVSLYDASSVATIVSPDSPKFPTHSQTKSPSHSIKSRISNESTSPKFPLASPAKKVFFGCSDKFDVNDANKLHQTDMNKINVSKVIDSARDIVDSVIKEVSEAKEIPDVASVETNEKAAFSESVSDKKITKEAIDIKETTKSFLSNEQKDSAMEVKANDEKKSEIVEDKMCDEIKCETVDEKKNEIFIGNDKKEPVEEKLVEKIEEFKEVEKVVEEEVKLIEKETKIEAVVEKKAPLVAQPTISSAPEAPLSSQKQPKQSHKPRRQRLIDAKPPNVLVYSDSTTTRSNVIKTLGGILKTNMYTIYPLTAQQVRERIWLDNTTLLVVCGSVNGSDVSKIFLEFFFKGGKVLCLCSDLLRQVLPTYHTAEVIFVN